MAGKPHVEEESFLDKIPMTFRDYPGDVELSESPVISVAHLDAPSEADKVTAPEPAAKSAKKEN